jgi:hypothetical protein
VLVSGPLLVTVKTIGTVEPLGAVAGALMLTATSAPWFTVMALVSLAPPPTGAAVTLSVPCVSVRSSTLKSSCWFAASVMPEQVSVPNPAEPSGTLEVQVPDGTAAMPM